ncbi:MAG: 30S ribosomal protein S17 [Deltaproteobacteria bacterium]|nr:30S ribosomal protein S17 [Deltaproteobacteria bacterium]
MAEKKITKRKIGIVVSDKMQKTVVVQVRRLVKHREFKKFIRLKKKFMAHDEANACKIGDKVEIAESRPLSARKRWVVNKILEKSKTAGLTEVSEIDS